MAQQSPMSQNIGDASGIAGILTQLLGKKGGTETTFTSGGTETKQTMLNVADMMKQLLEGAGTAGYGKAGLAANLAAGRRAGVYGGKSTELNLNDLLSRITTEAAIAGAPTTVSKSPTTSVKSGVGSAAGVGMGNIGMLAAGLLATSPSARKKITDLLGGMFDTTSGDGTTVSPDFIAGLMSGVDPTTGKPMVDYANQSNYFGSIGGGGGGGGGGMDIFGNPAGSMFGGGGADGFSYDDASEFSGFDSGVNFADQANIDLTGASEFVNAGGADAAAAGAEGLPYLGSAYSLSQGNYGAAAGSAIGTTFGGPIGGAVGGAVGGWVDQNCFITTAILHALGTHGEDPKELQVLRSYRDTWLAANHPEDIKEYYAIAPKIVEEIEARTDSYKIWRDLYRGYLLPALSEVSNGNNEIAYNLYKQMVEVASSYSKSYSSKMESV